MHTEAAPSRVGELKRWARSTPRNASSRPMRAAECSRITTNTEGSLLYFTAVPGLRSAPFAERSSRNAMAKDVPSKTAAAASTM